MSVLTLPVPWTDEDKDGLKGVIEIHNTDLPRQNFEGSRVCELIAILNKKLQDLPQDGSGVRDVESIQLYGTRISDARLLESLIPGLESSTPRLVATVRARPNAAKGKSLVVFVKTLTGKTVIVACTSEDAVGYVKTRVRDEAHIPVANQRIMYGGKQLEDHRKLSLYKIQKNSSLHLVARLPGGGFSGGPSAPRSFADVSDGSKLAKLELVTTGPEWRTCEEGLNVEGLCENRDCSAYGEMIIQPMEFEYFNLMKNDIQCPECHVKVKPITCGFYSCAWKFEGIKASDCFSISSRWKEARGEKYYRFDESCRSVDWLSLLLVVKPLQESVAAKLTISSNSNCVSRNDVCTVCWSKFGSTSRESIAKSDCGHSFHRTCMDVWSEWCKSDDTLPSCPICRVRVSCGTIPSKYCQSRTSVFRRGVFWTLDGVVTQ